MTGDWLEVRQGDAPILISIPHAGTEIPATIEERLVDPWRARKDTDWHVDRLWSCAAEQGTTMLRTAISRTVIDVNRDPSGNPLYPGQATTSLCPLTTFDGEPLYRAGLEPGAAEIKARRQAWFDPYHRALASELARLRRLHAHVVLLEAHAIRSTIPRLFAGQLPHLSLGTNGGLSCDAALTSAVEDALTDGPFCRVTNGRFKGGWTTRHYGRPEEGIHAIQMETALRAYIAEPALADPRNWPPAYDEDTAAPLSRLFRQVVSACICFAMETI